MAAHAASHVGRTRDRSRCDAAGTRSRLGARHGAAVVVRGETLAAANYRDALLTSYAAEAAIEEIVPELQQRDDWNPLLSSPDESAGRHDCNVLWATDLDGSRMATP